MKKLKRILLIDDDDVTCFINKLFLEGKEIAEQIYCVHDGLDGLNFLREHCPRGEGPDLIFLDNRMPRMDGFEFLEALDDLEEIDCYKLNIVMLTTSVDMKDIQRAAPFGNKLLGYITKPLNISALKQILKAVAQKEAQRNNP